MVLAHLWKAERKKLPEISVLTVDHGLRPGSRDEAEKVAGWARARGFRHATLGWTGPKPQSHVQETARRIRYQLLVQWCQAHQAAALLTAHTRDDLAETVIMRLARGTGVEGLAGIPAWREIEGVIVYRPLLDETRLRLQEFLVSQNVSWIDDPSNEDIAFERIRVRKAWPDLARAGLSAGALVETARRAGRADFALKQFANDFIERHVRHRALGYAEADLQEFRSQPAEIMVRVLDRLIARYGQGGRAELAAIERVAAQVADPTQRPSRLTIGGAELAFRERTFLIGREPGRISPEPVPICGDTLWDHRWRITADSAAADLSVRPAAAVHPVPRDRQLPAFVQAGLPAVCDAAGLLYVPHCGQIRGNGGISATFIR
jgi:tRNA(Ile)-lysidine synthase